MAFFAACLGDRFRRGRDQTLQRGVGAGAEVFTHRGHVEVDVGHRVGDQLFPVGLAPFDRADDPVLFGSPGSEDNRARRRHPLPGQLGEAPSALQENHRARQRVAGPEAPGVVVASDDDQLLRLDGPRQDAKHVCGLDQRATLPDRKPHRQIRPAGEPVGEWEPPLPALGHGRPLHPRHDPRGRVPPQRLDGDPRQGHLVGGKPRRVDRRWLEGRQRVAGIVERLDRAALDRAFVGVPSFGVGDPAAIPGVGGVGIDDQSRRARFLGVFDLEAAVVLSVASHHDLALDVDAKDRKLLEVLGGAVIGVDDLGGDVAAAAVGVEARPQFGVARVRVLGQGPFDQRQRRGRRACDLNRRVDGPGQVGVKLVTPHHKADRPKDVGDPLDGSLVAGCARHVRLRPQQLVIGAQARGGRNRVERGLDPGLEPLF